MHSDLPSGIWHAFCGYSVWQADRERLEALQIAESTRLVLVEVEQALALERTASAELRIAVRSTGATPAC